MTHHHHLERPQEGEHGEHHHTGDSGESQDYATANKEFFAGRVADFDKPQFTDLAKRAATVFRKHYDFNEESTTVLDFACGVGLISRELAPYTKSIVGVDIVQSLIDNYNERVSNQGIAFDEMQGVCTELKGVEGELDGQKFDVAVCSASYHHFESVEDITRILAFFLKPGGVLLVIDIMDPEEDGAGAPSGSGGGTSETGGDVFPKEYHHVVAHMKGFKSERLRKVFEGAGLTSFVFEKSMKAKFHGDEHTLFLAKGTKQSEA